MFIKRANLALTELGEGHATRSRRLTTTSHHAEYGTASNMLTLTVRDRDDMLVRPQLVENLREMYEKYIARDSTFEVNCPMTLRKDFENMLSKEVIETDHAIEILTAARKHAEDIVYLNIFRNYVASKAPKANRLNVKRTLARANEPAKPPSDSIADVLSKV